MQKSVVQTLRYFLLGLFLLYPQYTKPTNHDRESMMPVAIVVGTLVAGMVIFLIVHETVDCIKHVHDEGK